jgi:SAM-dependent methyltransferase
LGEERYHPTEIRDDVEIDRLAKQASIFDPNTIRHLETIGVSEGWKCLEVGAGEGSIAKWLSSRVGPAGRVVATDINTKFLNRITISNLEIRQHNILKDELEEDYYDLVHCRKLLIHLPEPEKAVRRMADALGPGGWLLIEEDDWGSVISATVTDPYANPFTDAWVAWVDSLRKRGLVDYYFGRQVRGLVEGLGFTDVGQDGWTCILRGGDPFALMYGEACQRIVKPMIAEGILTQEQYETIQRGFVDSSLNIPWYTLFSAWGKKPVGERRN